MVEHCRAFEATGAPTVILLLQQVNSQQPNFEPGGREFESLRARQLKQRVTVVSSLSLMLWVALWVANGLESALKRCFQTLRGLTDETDT